MEIIKELKKGEIGRGILIERDAGFIDPFSEKNNDIVRNLNRIGDKGVTIEEPLILTCILQKFDVENANHRIYPKRLLEREWDKYVKNRIQTNSGFGEVNHPAESTIDLSRIGINIVDGWWEKNTLFGKVEIVMSPGFVKYGIISCQGDILANLLRKGIRIGVSSRGLGSVKQIMGKTMVQDDFELVCWDAVADPSTPGAYIFYDDKESQPFVESKTNKLKTIIESVDKFLDKNRKKDLLK